MKPQKARGHQPWQSDAIRRNQHGPVHCVLHVFVNLGGPAAIGPVSLCFFVLVVYLCFGPARTANRTGLCFVLFVFVADARPPSKHSVRRSTAHCQYRTYTTDVSYPYLVSASC
jgi:hypothetical protein